MPTTLQGKPHAQEWLANTNWTPCCCDFALEGGYFVLFYLFVYFQETKKNSKLVEADVGGVEGGKGKD